MAKREDELARAKGVRINRRGGAFPEVDLSVESEAALETEVELEGRAYKSSRRDIS